MTVVVGAREDFTLEAFRRVTVNGEGVVISPAAVRVMGEARAGFERLLRADPGGFIYGVTTRPGVEVGTAIPPEELRDYARRFRGVGRGFGRDCLDERVVRGIVFARLADFIGGHAKVRPELAQRVAALLDGPLPRVPLDGQGGAGEILPLMHVMAAVDAGDLVEGEGPDQRLSVRHRAGRRCHPARQEPPAAGRGDLRAVDRGARRPAGRLR